MSALAGNSGEAGRHLFPRRSRLPLTTEGEFRSSRIEGGLPTAPFHFLPDPVESPAFHALSFLHPALLSCPSRSSNSVASFEATHVASLPIRFAICCLRPSRQHCVVSDQPI